LLYRIFDGKVLATTAAGVLFCVLCQNSIPEVEFYSGLCQFSLLCQNSIPVFVKGMLF